MPDPTRVEGAGDAGGRSEQTTAEAPVRWSGAAPVPSTPPKRSRWSRRRPAVDEDEDDWGATPAVDPWADQDTPWSPLLIPVSEPLPPTRIDPPASRVDQPAMPKTRIDAPATPKTRVDAPAPNPAPKRGRWGRRKEVAPPVNRGPVQTRPYSPPPPPWHPTTTRPPLAPAGRPPVATPARPPLTAPPRRRRRWPRNLLILTVLGCGVPAYFAWPAARQYPVTAVLPDQVRDLSLRDDAASKQAVDRLSRQLRNSNLAGQEVFAGVYSDGNGKKVTVFGTTGLRITPGRDVEAELSHLTGDFDITEVESFDLGEAGAHERCGIGRSGGNGVVVCAWADHGSLATVLLTRRNVSESAQLVADLRSVVLTRP